MRGLTRTWQCAGTGISLTKEQWGLVTQLAAHVDARVTKMESEPPRKPAEPAKKPNEHPKKKNEAAKKQSEHAKKPTEAAK